MHDSNLYQLTIHELLPSDMSAYAKIVAGGEWFGYGTLGEPLGVWQSLVGQLNRVFFLHSGACNTESDIDSSTDKLLAAPFQPVARSVQWLRAVKPVALPSPAALFELRYYSLIPGGLVRYIPLLLDVLPARQRYSPNVGIWTSLSGCSDLLVHMWAYRDANEQAKLRPAINADPAWQRFVSQILPLIRSMQSYFLVPFV
jgi:NIPSNAP